MFGLMGLLCSETNRKSFRAKFLFASCISFFRILPEEQGQLDLSYFCRKSVNSIGIGWLHKTLVITSRVDFCWMFVKTVLNYIQDLPLMVGGCPLRRDCDPPNYIETWKGIWERRAKWMLTLKGLIAVLSLCIGCFSLGYAIGSRDNDKTQK